MLEYGYVRSRYDSKIYVVVVVLDVILVSGLEAPELD